MGPQCITRIGSTLAVMAAFAVMAAGDAPLPGDTITVTHATDLAAATLSSVDRQRLQQALESVPEGHSVEGEFESRAPDGSTDRVFRYLIRVTARNPEGLQDGPEIRYANWYQPRFQTVLYSNGKRHGMEQQYSQDGRTLLAEIPWANGTINGVRRAFHRDGSLQTETPYQHGTIAGESRSFGIDGQLIRTVQFVDGQRHGESIDFWPEKPGQAQRIIPYHEGQVHGTARAFYLDGSLHWERPFESNNLHGVERHYDGDGEVRRTVYWIDNVEVSREQWEATR